MPQIDLDGLNSRLYINELRSQSTSTIVVPSSTTLTVDTLALTKLEGNVTVAAGHSITVTDPTGLNVGGVEIVLRPALWLGSVYALLFVSETWLRFSGFVARFV